MLMVLVKFIHDQSKVYYIDYYQNKLHGAQLGHFPNPMCFVPTKRWINRFYDDLNIDNHGH